MLIIVTEEDCRRMVETFGKKLVLFRTASVDTKTDQVCVLVALFPGPTQLSVAISMEKRERTWYLFSHE